MIIYAHRYWSYLVVKSLLRTLFAPILNIFESGDAGAVCWLVWGMEPTYLLPVVVFGSLAFLSLLIGLLGTDRAVAKVWNSRK